MTKAAALALGMFLVVRVGALGAQTCDEQMQWVKQGAQTARKAMDGRGTAWIRSDDARRNLPDGRRGISWGVGAVVDTERGGAIRGTAAMIARNFILTAGHPFISRAMTVGWQLMLGVEVETDAAGEVSIAGRPGLHCFFLKPETMISSPRGYLDFAIFEIRPKDDVDGMFPDTLGFRQLPIKPYRGRPVAGEVIYSLAYTDTSEYPYGLTLLYGGNVVGSHRYTKDAGTNITLDHDLDSTRGHSGAPLLDARFEWTGVHQRELGMSFVDTQTDWHPYRMHFYADWDPAGKDPTHAPRQGTLLIDIADNVLSRKGAAWLCRNIPAFHAFLEDSGRPLPACDCEAYKSFRAQAVQPPR